MSLGLPPDQDGHLLTSSQQLACHNQVVQDNKMVKWISLSSFPLEWQPQANRRLCKDGPVLSKIKMFANPFPLKNGCRILGQVNAGYRLHPPHLWHWQLGAKCKHTHYIFLAVSPAWPSSKPPWMNFILWQKFWSDMPPFSLVGFW